MSNRKQVYELTLDDVRQTPVWEFAFDEEGVEGQDEATVRPYKASRQLDPAEGMFIVRAAFTLADGSSMEGYLTPGVQGDTSLGAVQPTIITEQGQVDFWCGANRPTPDQLSTYYRLLGKKAAQVFPLRFQSRVDLLGGAVKGTITGFTIVTDFKSNATQVVQ